MRLRQGGLIDRTQALPFRFDGRALEGHPGDTLASALLANGVRLLGRSFKYHRPRGIVAAGADEPNALVELGTGARLEPNTLATQVELYDGLVASSQNRWPSLRFDVMALNSLLAPILPAGFYYKTFMWPASFVGAGLRASDPPLGRAGSGRARAGSRRLRARPFALRRARGRRRPCRARGRARRRRERRPRAPGR